MPLAERAKIEAVLVEYVERYGLTPAAREYFNASQSKNPVILDSKPTDPQEKCWVEKMH